MGSVEFAATEVRLKIQIKLIMLNFLLGSIFVALAFGQDPKKENPTWFIPSQEKPSSENDQSFCSQELATISDTDLYQTRTSEILLPADLPPSICIIFPFAPNTLIWKGDQRRLSQWLLLLQTSKQKHSR